MTKKEIRKIYRERRLAMSASEQNRADDLLLIQFQQLGIEIPGTIMTYAAMEKSREFDPHLITDYCHFKNPNAVLCYTVINKESNTMQAMRVTADTVFELNEYGIAEPVDGVPVFTGEIDMVLLPLLYFDDEANRVGYGKGYYDRFLAHCRRDCVKIGFSYFEPVETIDDLHEYDIKLDYGITPGGIFVF
jgi:5-formyltetrahydrofolate cyclo-ligase